MVIFHKILILGAIAISKQLLFFSSTIILVWRFKRIHLKKLNTHLLIGKLKNMFLITYIRLIFRFFHSISLFQHFWKPIRYFSPMLKYASFERHTTIYDFFFTLLQGLPHFEVRFREKYTTQKKSSVEITRGVRMSLESEFKKNSM